MDLNTLDETIKKLERIKELLQDILELRKAISDLPETFLPGYAPKPEPMPWIPCPSAPKDPPWKQYKIWC